MRVLVTADAVGGVFTYAAELARALAARGVEVALAVEGARLAPDQRRGLLGVRGLSVHEAPFRLEWMEDPWDDVAAAGAWLLDVERRERPDVVHLDAFSHGALPFRAPKLVVGHSCVLSWWEAVRGGRAPAEWNRYRAAVRRGLVGADLVAAPSAAMARALVRHHGPLDGVRVVPNGRDPARFPPGAKEPLVLGSGRLWDEAKNAAALARVAPALPWAVAIAGEVTRPSTPFTPSVPRLRPHSARPTLGMSGSRDGRMLPRSGRRDAALLGRLSEAELAEWLGRAAIFAHPARYEPFGLGVLEAALAGCALVLGDVESLRENWDGAAVFVDPADDGALAAALAGLARDGARRNALAARARTRALRLRPEAMARGYLGLYRTLLARRRAARAAARAAPAGG